MDAEERESGITFGELCRLIGKKIWLVLGIAAAVTVLAVVLFALVVNPMSTYYSMNFELVYPSASTRQYPDGTPFSYRNIISRTMLEAAKRMDERLTDTDVATMLSEDHIMVTAQTDGEDAGATVTYTVTVKGSYFENAETAQLFIRCVADATVNDIKSRAASLSYGISEDTFNGNNFEARLGLLSDEYDTILAAYDTWISTYSGGYQVTVGGELRSLSDYRAQVNGLYADAVRTALTQECESGGYGLLYGEDEETVVEEAVTARVEQLIQEYESNKSILAALSAGTNVITPYARSSEGGSTGSSGSTREERIAYYTERNAVIANQLGNRVGAEGEGTLTVARAQAFATKLNGYFTALNAAADTLRDVTTAIYQQNTFAEFVSQNADSTGDTNIVLVAVAAFVLAFLVAAIIVCATEYSRQRRGQEPAAELSSAEGGPDSEEGAAPPADASEKPEDGNRTE